MGTSPEAMDEANKKILETFYSAFQRKEGETMAQLYSPSAQFEDEVFKLEGSKIGSMWKMLCKNGKDLKISYSILAATRNSGRVQWTAEYTFSATGRKVINSITAHLELKDGLIVKHRDHFSFWKWASQALGPMGFFLGWTSVVKGKVKAMAAQNLEKFINQS